MSSPFRSVVGIAMALALSAGCAKAEVLLGFERFTGDGAGQQGDMADVMTEAVLVDTLAAMTGATCPIRMIETLRRDDLLKELELQGSPAVDPATAVTPNPLTPNAMVRGRVTEGGGRMRWAIEVQEVEGGAILATHSGEAALEAWDQASEEIGRALVQQVCTARPAKAYHFSCGGGDPIEQDVCDVSQTFVLEGAMFGIELSGGPQGSTVIVRAPNIPGVTWSGSGTYQMTFPDGPGKPGTMVVNAGGTTTAGGISQETSGQETCVLTPIPACP